MCTQNFENMQSGFLSELHHICLNAGQLRLCDHTTGTEFPSHCKMLQAKCFVFAAEERIPEYISLWQNPTGVNEYRNKVVFVISRFSRPALLLETALGKNAVWNVLCCILAAAFHSKRLELLHLIIA